MSIQNPNQFQTGITAGPHDACFNLFHLYSLFSNEPGWLTAGGWETKNPPDRKASLAGFECLAMYRYLDNPKSQTGGLARSSLATGLRNSEMVHHVNDSIRFKVEVNQNRLDSLHEIFGRLLAISAKFQSNSLFPNR